MSPANLSPTPFGQYQLIEKIAQGGMAEIFKGKALDLHGIERTVVIKRILPHIAASHEFVDMLIDEAKINVMLTHGNIAQIYDLGKVGGDYFIVMEYVEGKTLSQIMKRLRLQGKQMPIACAVSICAEISNGLDYMHRKTDENGNPLNIVHRDISPQNIILSTAGTVKIIDFGIAKAQTKVSTTDSGVLKGKFAYMSPEHAEGEKLDYRTDIFSLGIVFFELLTGQRLFKGKNNAETIRKIKKTKVPTPSGSRSSIPKALNEIVFKALRRDRKKRYQSAHDFSQDLTKFLIGYKPDFSPRELVRFLHDLFPETAPSDRAPNPSKDPSKEETPLQPQAGVQDALGKPQKSQDEDPFEATVHADSDVIRAKLKETEVFHVPDRTRKEDPAPSQGPLKKVRQIRSPRLRRQVTATLISLTLLTAMGLSLYRLSPWSRRKPSPLAETQQTVTLPSPQIRPLEPAEPLKAPVPGASSQPPPSLGSFLIDSQPRGAQVFLNDSNSGKVTPAILSGIPLHRPQKIGLHLEHHKFWEGKVEIREGTPAKLSVPLEINYGELEINSLPAGAQVQLNGRRAGRTPFRLTRLKPETTYEVTLKYPGYEPWERKIKIFGGKQEVISASLKKIPLE